MANVASQPKRTARELITSALVKLSQKDPALYLTSLKMEPVPTNDPNKTLCIKVSGGKADLVYNPNFVSAVGDPPKGIQSLKVLIGAEAARLLLLHATTRIKSNKPLSLLASNLTISDCLKNLQTTLPKELHHLIPSHEKYGIPQQKTFEQYYELLLAEQERQNQACLKIMQEQQRLKQQEQNGNSQKGMGKSKGSEGMNPDQNDNSDSGGSEQGENQNGKKPSKGKNKKEDKQNDSQNGSGGNEGEDDETQEKNGDSGGENGKDEKEEQDGEGDDNGDGKEKDGNQGNKPNQQPQVANEGDALERHFNPGKNTNAEGWEQDEDVTEDARYFIQANEEMIRQAMKEQGSIGGALALAIIEAAGKPETNPRTAMRRFLSNCESSVTEDTRMKPHRRHGWTAPGVMKTMTCHVLCGMDESGSVSNDERNKLYVEGNAMTKLAEMDFISWDTRVYEDTWEKGKKYKPRNKFKVANSHGGTSPECLFEFAKKHKYKNVLCLTDGCFSEFKMPGKFKICWITTQETSDFMKQTGLVLELKKFR